MKKSKKIQIVFIVSLFFVTGWSNLYCDNPPDYDKKTLVTTKNGKICGLLKNLKLDNRGMKTVREYIGIPYAEPPIVEKRWAPPVPKGNWELIEATGNCRACPQNETGISPLPEDMGEDCLYLNIWAPEITVEKTKFPVMIYIHGGAYIAGHGKADAFNGAYMATSGEVIVVTINYRLGAFGFLSFKDVNGKVLEGNYGMMDIILAINWISENIGSFGGDPQNITIFGESAGANAVGGILAMENPPAFHAAIMQSNPFTVPFFSISQARTIGWKFARSLGCKTVEKLRGKTYTEILESLKYSNLQQYSLMLYGIDGFLEWKPVIDGKLFRKQPIKVEPKKPVIIGTNEDEGIMLAELIIGELPDEVLFTTQMYTGLIEFLFKDDTISGAILEEYDPKEQPPREQFYDVLTHYWMTAADHYYVKETSPDCRLYPYLFTHVPHCNISTMIECCDFACHGDEVIFVFHSFDKALPNVEDICREGEDSCKETDEERIFSDNLVSLWTSFARKKYPTANIGTTWQEYKEGNHYLKMPGPDEEEPGRPQFEQMSAGELEKLCNYTFWKDVINKMIVRRGEGMKK